MGSPLISRRIEFIRPSASEGHTEHDNSISYQDALNVFVYDNFDSDMIFRDKVLGEFVEI